jgi:hypothetical protein
MYDWMELAALAAAGAFGGLLHWTYSERDRLLVRVREFLRRR